jgi:hypothetical protein
VAATVWETIRATPAHVTRAPAPRIASPQRAEEITVNDMVADLRAQASSGGGGSGSQPRRGLLGWLRRTQAS